MLSRRPPAPPELGASSMLLLLCAGLLVVAGIGAAEVVAVTAGDARAEQAAAAAAHAAEGALAHPPGGDDLSVAVQAARTVCGLEETGGPVACALARAAASMAARANGAELVALAVGPDLRDRGADAAPGRVVAIATVELRRRLPVLERVCAAPHPRPTALCVARATAAARLSGRGVTRVSLVDAPEAVRELRWQLDHPRDADTGAGHRLAGLVTAPLLAVTRLAGRALGDAAAGVSWLLAALGPVGEPLAFGWGLLGASFDGRGLHAGLTELAMLLLAGPLLAPLSRIGAVHIALAPFHATVSFAVGVLTGVDDSDRVRVGGVAIALVCDLLVLTKPLAIAGRVGLEVVAARITPGATVASGALRGTLAAAKHAGDLISGKPSTVLRLVGIRPRRNLAGVLDAASLAYRPGAAANQVTQMAGRLAHWGRTVAVDTPLSENALAAALARVGHAPLRGVEQLAELSQLHSGARTLGATAGGGLQPLGDPPPPPRLRLPDPGAR